MAAVDGRTAAREAFRKGNYLKLGIQESDDQVAAACHLGSLPMWMAAASVSGGGAAVANVLMSMSRGSGAFKAGVAIAP